MQRSLNYQCFSHFIAFGMQFWVTFCTHHTSVSMKCNISMRHRWTEEALAKKSSAKAKNLGVPVRFGSRFCNETWDCYKHGKQVQITCCRNEVWISISSKLTNWCHLILALMSWQDDGRQTLCDQIRSPCHQWITPNILYHGWCYCIIVSSLVQRMVKVIHILFIEILVRRMQEK